MRSRSPEAPPRVLVVDDDESLREVLGFWLGEVGISVSLASDGEEALRLLERQHYELIITDLKMPKLGGMELLRSVRGRWMASLVIVISAFADEATVAEVRRSGAFDFLPKPCDRKLFKLTVKRALDLYSEQAALRQTA